MWVLLTKGSQCHKRICTFTSVELATSVRHFFKQHGFTNNTICKLISSCSCILSADVKKALQPNLQALRKMGFTEAELELLIPSNPYVLTARLAIPRLKFWQTFIGTNNRKVLVSVFRRNPGLIGQDIVSGIAPMIALLKQHGLSETDIVGLAKRGRGVITLSIKSLEALQKSAKELGFDPKSPMFGQALLNLCGLGKGSIEEKMEFFKGFWWSEEFLAALTKAPFFLNLSKGNILEKMDFLVGRAGCNQSYIASNPVLLMLSLEKRSSASRVGGVEIK